jgi:hypothetical protein
VQDVEILSEGGTYSYHYSFKRDFSLYDFVINFRFDISTPRLTRITFTNEQYGGILLNV